MDLSFGAVLVIVLGFFALVGAAVLWVLMYRIDHKAE
jgi:hypothetical protein